MTADNDNQPFPVAYVDYDTKTRKFIAVLNGKRVGVFDTEEEAWKALRAEGA